MQREVVRWRPKPGMPPEWRLIRTLTLRRRVRVPALRYLHGLPPSSRLRRWVLERVIRVAFELFNRGDIRMAICAHARDAEIVTPLGGLDIEIARGSRAAFEGWSRWAELWEQARRELEEVVDAGDRTLFICTQVGVGRDGMEIRQPLGLLFEYGDGEVVRHHEFLDIEEGLRALDSQEAGSG